MTCVPTRASNPTHMMTTVLHRAKALHLSPTREPCQLSSNFPSPSRYLKASRSASHFLTLVHDKTRQQLRSESRQLSSQSTTAKKGLSLQESKHLSERDGTLQCSAAQSGTDAMVPFSTVASVWAPEAVHMSMPAGCLAARKKRKKGFTRSHQRQQC